MSAALPGCQYGQAQPPHFGNWQAAEKLRLRRFFRLPRRGSPRIEGKADTVQRASIVNQLLSVKPGAAQQHVLNRRERAAATR